MGGPTDSVASHVAHDTARIGGDMGHLVTVNITKTCLNYSCWRQRVNESLGGGISCRAPVGCAENAGVEKAGVENVGAFTIRLEINETKT